MGENDSWNAFNTNMSMADSMYNTSYEARKAGTMFATDAYQRGGFDQSAKYTALQSGILDAFAAKGLPDFRNPQALGSGLAARAEAVSNVGSEKIMAGMDEMNRIRSTLAGNGLQTTNFAQGYGETATKALGLMDESSTMSTINAGLGLASTIYGAVNKKPSSPPSSGSQFGFGLQGSDLSNWQTTPITSLVPPGQFSFTGRE
jgi:hypothetical protein